MTTHLDEETSTAGQNTARRDSNTRMQVYAWSVVFKLLGAIAFAVAIPAAAYLHNTQQDHEKRLVRIEATQITQTRIDDVGSKLDALKDQISEVKQRLIAIETKLSRP